MACKVPQPTIIKTTSREQFDLFDELVYTLNLGGSFQFDHGFICCKNNSVSQMRLVKQRLRRELGDNFLIIDNSFTLKVIDDTIKFFFSSKKYGWIITSLDVVENFYARNDEIKELDVKERIEKCSLILLENPLE